MSETSLTVVWVTLKLASVVTIILFLVATPLAWWLSQTQSRYKPVISALFAVPLVLPPTVMGFYLLLLLGPNGPIGQLSDILGLGILPFSFTGIAIACAVHSFPFVIQPLQNAFESIGKRPLEVAATLGASPLDCFWNVVIPLARPGFITAMVMGFCHAIGEFGVVLMIGGNIPGKTRVLSVQIYNHVEAMEYAQAHWLAGSMVIFSFLALLIVYLVNQKAAKRSMA
ncbi:molybdate ABC transporter permease subunit [Psychromonas antarctica]|jgi:molybdate transport system permease protein|uniref:molybdate ABC transporter permease subunit n=1 Tax=Psychromonas antarctica TaxID=67573 RepID=UPI001EE95536|nr:molybdate ABC transporter permease subunit [Psychromonas antarctica]MCG6200286.1 molybdate ABC transporter permease subunit [Psychromonas antarctica]